MTHHLLVALLMLIPVQYFPAHATQVPAALPTVSISLPADIPPETTQIRYLMSGSFGGCGGYVEPKPGQTAYEIEVSMAGEPAKSIKVFGLCPRLQFSDLRNGLTKNSKFTG
jgi:hypothetical protein